MTVPTPLHDPKRDDRFNRGLERLLAGDTAGIDEIEPELRDVAQRMVALADDAGWIGAEPEPEGARTPWWHNGGRVLNAIAAILLVGLVAVMVSVGVRVWDRVGTDQHGSDIPADFVIELGPGVCSRTPRTDAEIAAIVRLPEDGVAPFQGSGVEADFYSHSLQLTRDWNQCLMMKDWPRAMAYESPYFIWMIGQQEFPQGSSGLTDTEIADRMKARHREIEPFQTSDGQDLRVYSMETLRLNTSQDPPLLVGVDVWIVPAEPDGTWITWPVVMTIEWDGSQWVIVATTQDGVPVSSHQNQNGFEPTPTSTP